MPCPGQDIHRRAKHRSVEAVMLRVRKDDEHVHDDRPWARLISPPTLTICGAHERLQDMQAAMLLECHTRQQCGKVPALFERVDEARSTAAARFDPGLRSTAPSHARESRNASLHASPGNRGGFDRLPQLHRAMSNARAASRAALEQRANRYYL